MKSEVIDRMKNVCTRIWGLLTALALLIGSFSVYASAEPADTLLPLTRLYNAGESLLTGLDNMTVQGQADFSLDGVHFKHAEGLYAQQGYNSYQRIQLQTPRSDGSILENGYSVLDLSGGGFYVERYPRHIIISQITNAPKDRVLRNTVSSQAVLSLGRQIAEVMDRQLQVDALEADHHLQLNFQWSEEDIPPILNGALNLFWQEAVRRYFEISFDDMPLEGYASISDFSTVTQGILFCTRDLSILSLQVSGSLDQEGRLVSLEGKGSSSLHGRSGDAHTLDISFSLKADKYGSTVLPDDVPEEDRYDLRSWNTQSVSHVDSFFDTLAASGNSWANLGLPDIPWPKQSLKHRNISGLEDAVSYAGEIACLDLLSLENGAGLIWSASVTDSGYEVLGAAPDFPDKPVFSVLFTESGEVLRLENLETRFSSAEPVEEDDSDTSIRWRSEISLMLWLFEENLNPGFTKLSDEMLRILRMNGIGYCGYEGTVSSGDQTFYVGYAATHHDAPQKVKYVVQTSPEVRVILRDSTIDPTEGGNG